MSNNNSNRFLPLWLAISAIIGILIGTFYGNLFSGNKMMNVIQAGSNKLSSLMYYLSDKYVDDVNVNDLVEKSIPVILSELDPHSAYIPQKNAAMSEDDLRGSFSGIGVEFTIYNDTVRVQRVIPGGPAEKAGVLAGDNIVMVDGDPFTGETVTNEEAMLRLKGPKGSKVEIGVQRYREKQVRKFVVTRDEIKTKSVTATFMLDDNTGYIKLRNFGENTYPEMLVALARLSQSGFERLIIDLRGNTGGYVSSAYQIANEFLPANRTVVYMEGKHTKKEVMTSNGHGSYQDIPLVVLIDQGSASASEILAGAIQDNDRGTIVGRRSFGKGLVQEVVSFTDGSLMRLTIARYYTPAGRCIQKPYEQYDEELLMRYERGEYFSGDSIKHEGPVYHTVGGREVYGGGGITPDLFVPEDTTNYTSYYKEAMMSGLVYQFCFDYTDEHRDELQELLTEEELEEHLNKQNLVELFAQYAAKNGLQRRNLMISQSHRLLQRVMTERIIYNILDEESLLQYQSQEDPVIRESLRLFKEGAAFPLSKKGDD